FGAAALAYLFMMTAGRLLPELAGVLALLLAATLVVFVELLLVAVLLRKFTARALLIEAGAVLLTNLAGYGLVLYFGFPAGPVPGVRYPAGPMARGAGRPWPVGG